MAHSLTTAHKFPADTNDRRADEHHDTRHDDQYGINEHAQRKVYGGFNFGAAFFGCFSLTFRATVPAFTFFSCRIALL